MLRRRGCSSFCIVGVMKPGQVGRETERIVVAYEAGRDDFRLPRWLRARDVEAYVIHPMSIAVSREHRRAKTDRLDTELLMRAFLG
jgi:transposase